MNEEPTGEDDAPDLPVHVVLGGKYELVDVLGTGATFTVYEAQRVAPAPQTPEPAASEAEADGAADADGSDTGDETGAAVPGADAEKGTGPATSEAGTDGSGADDGTPAEPDADAPDSATSDAATAADREPADGESTDAESADHEDAAPEVDPDQPLVVKVLHPHLVDDQNARASLRREVEASALIDHPGVVKVLDSGEEDVAGASVPWTVMNRVPGESLSDFAGDIGLPWRAALTIVDGLLESLEAVHAAGLVHRDVAPRNVMVERRADGSFAVGLLDLGLTRPAGGDGDGATVAGSVIGMSPEQARGKPLDARSDLYAAGALAYYLLTGHAPYERAQPEDVLRAHVNAPVPAASARSAAVPASVDRLVSRAMAKDPNRRFPTAESMRQTVTVLLGGPVAGAATGDDTMQLGVAAGGTEVIDPIAAGTMRFGQMPEGGDRTMMVGAVDADEVESPAPAPTDPPGERKWWHALTTGRGRVVTIVVFALLVLGGAGLVVANILGDDSPPAVTPSVSPSPEKSSKDPSPSSTPSDTETVYIPPPEPEYTPTEEPTDQPTDEPTDEPTNVPTDPPTTDPPVDPPTSEPTGEAGGQPTTPADQSR